MIFIYIAYIIRLTFGIKINCNGTFHKNNYKNHSLDAILDFHYFIYINIF